MEEDGKLLVATMPLLNDGTYTVRLLNGVGHGDRSPRLNRITVLPDKPPTVELLKPGRQSSAALGAEIPVMIRAADNHGLGRLQLEMKLQSPLPLGEDNSKEDKEQSGNLRDNRPHPNPLPEGEGDG